MTPPRRHQVISRQLVLSNSRRFVQHESHTLFIHLDGESHGRRITLSAFQKTGERQQMNCYKAVAEDIPKPNGTPNRLRRAPISRHPSSPRLTRFQRGLFVLLSHAHRTMLRMSTHSGSFLDCLPRGGRILPRRILMGATTMSHLYGFKTEREQYVWKKWRSFAFLSSA